MKAIKFIILGIGLIFASETQAQISVNLNVGTPPQWGPSGYSNVRYYYLPDVQAYYDVQNSNFIYISGNSWVRHSYLPRQYRDYDLYNGYKVVLTSYRGNWPHAYFKHHKVKYAKGYKGKHQKSIGNKGGNGNYKSKGNSNGNYKPKGNGNGNYKPKGNGNGNQKSNGNGNGKKH
ncbi:MAG: hypothetical protein ACYCZ2_18065 [Lutibacter sp.]